MSQTHLLSILHGLVCVLVVEVSWRILFCDLKLFEFPNITFKFQIHISRHILTFLLLSLSHIFFYLGRDSWIFFINYTVNLQGSKTKTRADEEVEVRQKWTKVSCRFLALVRCGIQWVLNNGNKTNIPKNEMSIPSMYTVLI